MSEFEQIYRAYFYDVFLYLCRLSGDELVAEELTSETFFKAMGSLSGFRGECELRVWLCQIAKHCYFSHRKKAGRSEPMQAEELAQLPARGETPEEQIVRREEAAQLRALVRHLPQPYQQVLAQRVFAQMSFRQIGRLFGKSDNWACVTYHRAKAMIRSRLEENPDEK